MLDYNGTDNASVANLMENMDLLVIVIENATKIKIKFVEDLGLTLYISPLEYK